MSRNRYPTPWPRQLGIGLICALGASLAAAELGLGAAAVAASAAILYSLHRGRAGPWLLAFPAALAAVALPPEPVAWPRPGPVRVSGTVLPGIRRDPPGATTMFRVGRGDRELLCISPGLPPVLPGDRIVTVGRLSAQPERQRLELSPQVQVPTDLQIRPGPPSLARLTTWCRHALQDSALRLYPGREGQLLTSLVLGRGLRLPDELQRAHRATGLSHLLAVSGAHASILAWLLALLWGTWAGRSPLSSRSFRRSCAIGLLFYGAVTGLEPPVFRALAAWLLALVASARGRRVHLVAALGLPALLTLLLAPDGVLEVGFALSYAAVFGLSLAHRSRQDGWFSRWVLMPIAASFWATATTAPITLWVFGQLAPWTILATPLLAPLVVIMLAGGLITAVLGCFAPGPAALLAAPIEACTWLYCEAVEILAALPGAPILAASRPGALTMVAAAGAALLVLVWRRNRWGVLGVCLCLCLPHLLPARDAGPPRLQLLTVGHGQACLVHMPDGAQVLIDCGSLGNPYRAARQVVDALGRRRVIDLLVLTHGDGDHSAGIPELLQRVALRRAVLPADLVPGPLGRALARSGVEVAGLDPGGSLEPSHGVTVDAPTLRSATSNDRSLWVRLQLGSFTALVTGDSEEAGTRTWLQSEAAGPADVLVLPHHGRENRSAGSLLTAVAPSLALVSNRGEAPTPQARLARQRGIRVLQTGTAGTITVHSGNPPTVDTERPLRLWRPP